MNWKNVRFGYKDQDGKGSKTGWVSWFHNALMQRRQIAFDGQKWYYQATPRSWFEPVGEDWVPFTVRENMMKHLDSAKGGIG